MIKQILKAFKDTTWDIIFKEFPVNQVRMSKPSYEAVRVSKDYMLVKIPHEKVKTNGNDDEKG